MTAAFRIRRTAVLLGATLTLTGSIALASPALAAPGQSLFPECFGNRYDAPTYLPSGGVIPGSLPNTGVIYAQPGGLTYGTSGDDVIIGTTEADTIFGLGGNDEICALGGNDEIRGDDNGGPYGNDYIEGGDGDDYILCVGGTDLADGGPGTDGPAYGHSCENYINK